MKKKYNKKYKKRHLRTVKTFSITLFILTFLALYAFKPSLESCIVNTYAKIKFYLGNPSDVATVTIIIIANFLIIKTLRTFRRNIKAGKKLHVIDNMSGEAFERYLMYNFQKQGYRVKTTPVTGDYGADLILSKGGTKICVQAKRYKSNVGNSAVQEIVAALAYYKCDYGMVVTNSYFTAAAKTLAKVNNIQLWDRNRIIQEFDIKK